MSTYLICNYTANRWDKPSSVLLVKPMHSARQPPLHYFFPTLQVEKSQILFTAFICCQGLTELVRDFLPSALGHWTHVIYTNRKHNHLILTARELSTHSKHLQCSCSHAQAPGGTAQRRPLSGQASLNTQFVVILCSVSSLTKSCVTSHERLVSYKNV